MFGLFKKKDNNTPCRCSTEPRNLAVLKCNVYSENRYGEEKLVHMLRVMLYACPTCGKRTYVATNDKFIVNEVKEVLDKWLARKITTQQICLLFKYWEE